MRAFTPAMTAERCGPKMKVGLSLRSATRVGTGTFKIVAPPSAHTKALRHDLRPAHLGRDRGSQRLGCVNGVRCEGLSGLERHNHGPLGYLASIYRRRRQRIVSTGQL